MDDKKKLLTESDVLKALYHMYCAAAYKGSVTMSSETAIGLYNFFNNQKVEIERLRQILKESSLEIKEQISLMEQIKAEVGRLQKHNTEMARKHYQDGKNEAIKEFAEVVKKHQVMLFNEIYSSFGFAEAIDNLVKEMVGEV